MTHRKGLQKLSIEMREAYAAEERRLAPKRARLKAETVIAIAAFNVRALTASPATFYPTIGAAIAARRYFLICECPACEQRGCVDLRKIDRHRGASIESLIPVLSCRECRPHAPFAKIIGLRKRRPF